MELRQHHKEELRAQMAANEEKQKRRHAEYLLEGEKTRQKLQAEKAFIEVRSCMYLTICATLNTTFVHWTNNFQVLPEAGENVDRS